MDRTGLINDGNGKIEEDSRWIGRGTLPHIVEFRWDRPVEVGAVRFISGFYNGAHVHAPITAFQIQRQVDGRWQDIMPGAGGNTNVVWASTFEAVTTDHLRLVITETPHGISRLWEVEFYGPVETEGAR